jgi:hypothetical protein
MKISSTTCHLFNEPVHEIDGADWFSKLTTGQRCLISPPITLPRNIDLHKFPKIDQNNTNNENIKLG